MIFAMLYKRELGLVTRNVLNQSTIKNRSGGVCCAFKLQSAALTLSKPTIYNKQDF